MLGSHAPKQVQVQILKQLQTRPLAVGYSAKIVINLFDNGASVHEEIFDLFQVIANGPITFAFGDHRGESLIEP